MYRNEEWSPHVEDPYRKLAAAVLLRALDDLRIYGQGHRRAEGGGNLLAPDDARDFLLGEWAQELAAYIGYDRRHLVSVCERYLVTKDR